MRLLGSWQQVWNQRLFTSVLGRVDTITVLCSVLFVMMLYYTRSLIVFDASVSARACLEMHCSVAAVLRAMRSPRSVSSALACSGGLRMQRCDGLRSAPVLCGCNTIGRD
jgi:hypothetical protein